MFGDFDTGVIFQNWHFLLEGMQTTLLLTVIAIGGGLVLGTLLALARLAPFKPLSFVAGSYVNFFRSMPLILVIFWFYFLVPLIVGRPVGGFYSVLIAFVLFEAAYYCEIMRAGIQSVRQGQIYAGQALGLTYAQNMRYVVLPQAFRNMIPILLTASSGIPHRARTSSAPISSPTVKTAYWRCSLPWPWSILLSVCPVRS